MLSIVLPTLDAAAALPCTLAALRAESAGDEIVVSDGGSRDGTRAIAEAAGARVIEATRGRGSQLAAGAAAATGDALLFLHADTIPAPGWRRAVQAILDNPANRERAAAFRFALDDDDARARRWEARVAWRCRRLGLAYGDQGLLIARDFYRALGGYRPLALFEDVDFVRRIGRKRLVLLDHPAVTSAARFKREGYGLRSARNVTLLTLYFLGAPVPWLARLYRA